MQSEYGLGRYGSGVVGERKLKKNAYCPGSKIRLFFLASNSMR